MTIGWTLAAAVLLGQPAASLEAVERSALVSVTDAAGAAVGGLALEDVAVIEDGAARRIVAFEQERRPLCVAVIVDSSEPVTSSFRLHVVPEVAAFLTHLPAGSRFAVWTTGDRPTRIVDFGTDVAAAQRALERTFPRGGNTLLDAVVEVSRELQRREGERVAMVAVTGLGIGFSNYDRRDVVERAAPGVGVFYGISYDEGRSGTDLDPQQGRIGRVDYEYVLAGLAERTGGRRETTLSAMGLDKALALVSAELGGQYLVRFDSPAGARRKKVEVTVARPDARVRVGRVRPE